MAFEASDSEEEEAEEARELAEEEGKWRVLKRGSRFRRGEVGGCGMAMPVIICELLLGVVCSRMEKRRI